VANDGDSHKIMSGEKTVEINVLSVLPAPLKPRQHGALQILYCIVLYCK